MADKEYIEREALLDGLDAAMKNSGMGYVVGQTMKRYVKRVPAADVAPVVHGEWKLHDNGDGTCNQCRFRQKHIWDVDNWQNYCGVCGAKMDVERKEATP